MRVRSATICIERRGAAGAVGSMRLRPSAPCILRCSSVSIPVGSIMWHPAGTLARKRAMVAGAFPAIEQAHAHLAPGWMLSIPRRAQRSARLLLHRALDLGRKAAREAVAAGGLAVRRAVARDPAFATHRNRRFGLHEIRDAAAQRPLDFPRPEDSDALARMIQQVLTNRLPIREAMARGERTYDDPRR